MNWRSPLPEQNLYSPTRKMTDKSLALILFALRELQTNIQYAPDQMLEALKNYYGVAIASPEELFETLDELAVTLNSGGENV
ncbi:MAG: hypothetical protein ACK52I_25070 [Pseudomonadota bacterium]|jgi:hypothetical protein